MDSQSEPEPSPPRPLAQEVQRPPEPDMGEGDSPLKQEEQETPASVITALRPATPVTTQEGGTGPGAGAGASADASLGKGGDDGDDDDDDDDDDDRLHGLHVPHDPDAPEFLPEFTWLGEPLGYPPETWEECITPLKQTAFIIYALRKSSWSRTAELMDTTKTVARLWYSKKSHTMGTWRIGNPLPDGDDRARYSTALYLLCPKINTAECRQCISITSKGPGYECVQPSNNFIKGACTNCYGKGVGSVCSLRLDAEQRKKEEPVVFYIFEPEKTAEGLKTMSTKDLEAMHRMLKTELRRRREQRADTKRKRFSSDPTTSQRG